MVSKYGTSRAYLLYNLDLPTNFKTDGPIPNHQADPLYKAIADRVYANSDYYLQAYDGYLRATLKATPTVDSAIDAFYARAARLGGNLVGEVLQGTDGNALLFPEAQQTFTGNVRPDVKQRFEALLTTLSDRFGVPFQFVDDPKLKLKGRYIFDGERRVVLINLAYADLTTPLHEYYHPVVRVLRNTNERLFNTVLAEAQSLALNPDIDSEELVTEYLAQLASKPTPVYYRFLNWLKNLISRVVGWPIQSIDQLSTIGDLMKYLESPDVASVVSLETTLTQADSSLMQVLKNMSSGSNAFKVKKDDSGLDYTVELPKLAQQQGVVTSDESAFYKDKAGNEVAIRLTQLVGDKELGEFSLKSKKFKYTQSEYVAREYFKQQGKDQGDRPASEITDTILMNGKETTYNELVQSLEKVFTEQRTYGKMVHAFIQYKLEVDPVKKEAAKLLANSYAIQVGLPFVTLETHPELSQYELEFDKVLKTAGIRLEGVLPDKVIPEISLVSKNIKDSAGRLIGTTLDSLIQHSNADVSLIDWKTGSLLSDAMSTRIMQYADNVQVSDTKLNRAYLELAFRALILKEHFPKMRFRKVAVVSLSKKGNHSLMTVDLAPFLTIIGNYYRETNPQIYQQLLDSKLLNVESYLGTKGEVMKALPSALHHVPLEEQMSFLQARIDSIMLGSTAEEIKKSPTLSADLKMYTEALLELKKQPGMDLDQKTDDIPSVTGLIKNFSDIANPKVQVLHKELLKARHESSNRMQEITKEHDRLSLEVIKEATSSTARTMRKVLALPLLYSIVTLNPGVLVGSIATGLILRRFGKNTKDVFGFMWKKSTAPGREGYFLNTTNEHEGKPLTPAQRAYRDHYTRTMRSIYTEVMSEVVAYSPNGKPITRAEANAKPIDLPDDFMPRVAASLSEIRENESYLKGFLGLQTHVKYFAQRHLSDYVEDTYTSQDGQQALPVKYFGHTGSKTVLKANHSFDPTKAFKLFVGNLIYKQNFDQLYNMAQGVKNALDMETDEAGNARYPNLTKWLDNEVYAQILQTPKPSRFTTRKWTYKVGVLGSKILDLPVGYHIEISQEKVINLARTSTTYLIMGFKLASAIRNGMLITVLNTMNATKATMARRMGIPPEDYRPTAKGTFAAFVDLKDFYALKLQGREEESKLWNLAKKFDWLPDNYPYSQDPKDFFSESIRFSLNSYTFSFHNMVETYGALAQLSMLMRTMQLTNDKGEKFSAWEAYSMKDGNLT